PSPDPPAADPHIPIPDPMSVRRLIGLRAAELALLRRLLRIADDRAKLAPILLATEEVGHE
ncbi:MAG: hypothetical protein ABGY75_18885, partial [Gemmataceae bacterium]